MKIARKHIIGFIIFDIILVTMFFVWWFLFRVQEGNYKSNVVNLGINFTAKNFCSCLFVAKQSEEACRDFVEIEQVKPQISIDQRNKVITAQFLFFEAKARYNESPEGCLLVE